LILGLRGEEFRKKRVYYLPLRIEEVFKGMKRCQLKKIYILWGNGRLDLVLGSYVIPGIK
jgi:hypothetical protein